MKRIITIDQERYIDELLLKGNFSPHVSIQCTKIPHLHEKFIPADSPTTEIEELKISGFGWWLHVDCRWYSPRYYVLDVVLIKIQSQSWY